MLFAMACGVTLFSGFIKGAVGFGMPMIMISGIGSFLSPELALAALILPTLLSNGWQALRQGPFVAVSAARGHWVFILLLLVFITISAGLVNVLPAGVLYLILGVVVSGFALVQLAGWRLEIKPDHQERAGVILGTMAGFVGGMSGVWGPPTVAYLTALNVPKVENVRVQGVIYGVGSLALLISHLETGVLSGSNLMLSVWMILPAMAGMAIGMRVHDRLDQARFRRMTLMVLVVAGANLVRRGLMA